MAENETEAEYEYYEDAAGEWRWRLQAGNNEIVSDGEGYASQANVLEGIRRHRHIAQTTRVRNTKTGAVSRLD
jgi:uncharacterized protein YegP (UPF0339 family)